MRMTSGAMPSTPTIVLNQLTNTSFINNYIEGEAAKSLLRLKASGHLTRENPVDRKGQITPHTYTIKQYINKLNLPKADINLSAKRLHLNKAFVTSIKDRSEAKNVVQQLKPDDVAVYTDGSGLDGNIGYGYSISTNKNQTKIANNSGSLPNFCAVFQSEFVAITQACIKMTKLNITDKNIYIFTDSLSAIKALNQLRISSSTILDCLNRINEVAANNSISLSWVPGHCNIPGNEVADGILREGTTTNTNVVAYIPYSYIKKQLTTKFILTRQRHGH